MTETDTPRVIDEAILQDVEQDIRRAEAAAEAKRARVTVALRDATAAEEHARLLPAVRKFLAARMGMTLEDALNEAQAELAQADTEVIEAAQRVERARTRLRDLEGWRRIQAEFIEERRAQAEGLAEAAPPD